nr:128 kDa replication protein [Rattail cactus necrosis-associated virus]
MSQLQNYVNKINTGAGVSSQHLLSNLAERVVYDQALESTEAQKRRPKYHFSKVVTPEQQNLITGAYPEFSINFTGTSASVHAVAGGLRGLELELLMTQIPFGAACFDIGGNYVRHLLKGRSYVHCCNPVLSVRDGARYESYRDELRKVSAQGAPVAGSWGVPGQGASCVRTRSLQPYQVAAFERYSVNPHAVVCDDTFQTCSFPPPAHGCTYAVLLHSLYDIPVHELGPALLRKNVHVAYAAFHLSEEMLWKDADGIYPVNDIDAQFERSGDRLVFQFRNEMTINYEHSFRNVAAHALKTFYPAGEGKIYFKEFLCRRVGTVFAKFTLVDTAKMHRSVFHKSVDGSAFISAMDEAFEFKRDAALFGAERQLLRDKASLSLWFPHAHNKVEIPVFRASMIGKKKLNTSKMLVDKDFFYTVFNHIMGYQEKNLNFQVVNNFVESVVSRVVINGTSVRAEWQVSKDLICDISLTLLLLVQLRRLENKEIISKVPLASDGFWSTVTNNMCKFFSDLWPDFLSFSVEHGWLQVINSKLVVKAPSEFLTFDDYLVMEYRGSSDGTDVVDVDTLIENSDKLYAEVGRLAKPSPNLSVDVGKFREFCNNERLSPEHVAKVFEAIQNDQVGLTVTGNGSVEQNLAKACEVAPPIDNVVACSENAPERFLHDGIVSGKLVLPLSGSTASEHNFWFTDDDGNVTDLSDFHMLPADVIAKPQKMAIFYKGSTKQQQMLNFLDYMAASLCATVNNLQRALKQWWAGDVRNPRDVGVFDCVKGKWITEPGKKNHTWGVAQCHDMSMRIVCVDYVDGKIVPDERWKAVAVSSETKVYSYLKMLHNLRGTLRDGNPPEPQCFTTLFDGVPGCGKTSEILRSCDFSKDLVLTPTREAAQMIRRRANEADKTRRADVHNVRTIDSFIMNPSRSTFDVVWVDEGLMCHPGLIWFCAVMSQCSQLKVFGDTRQIPFLPRVDNFDFPDRLKTLGVDKVEGRSVTHRCPTDVTAWLSNVYKRTVTTTSSIDRSVGVRLVPGKTCFDAKSLPLPGKVITFTQAEKFDLQKAGYEDVSCLDDVNKTNCLVNTVHEIQGETYPVVSLVRLNPHPISIIKKDGPHVVVALSRHTQALVYYTVTADAVVDTIDRIKSVNPFLLDMYKHVGGTA